VQYIVIEEGLLQWAWRYPGGVSGARRLSAGKHSIARIASIAMAARM
jgi:hypothetical protein